MKRSAAFVLFLAAAALSGQPCAPAPTRLCLSAGRFATEVSWKDFQGHTGNGQATPLTADTGYFWFFTDTNVELVVKVLDARAINGKFWVFFGALSNVEYTLTVRDSVTAAVKAYQNPSGQFASVGDTSAFAGSGVVASQETIVARGTLAPPSSIADIQRFIDRAGSASPGFAACPEASSTLYLSNCRFRLDVHWTTSQGEVGSGQAVQLTSDTGYFWFFSDTNVELMVKVLDARPINGKFWVFFGALSNVEYTINVVDTVSGALHSYHNPQSTFASVGDTQAFRGGFPVSIEPDAALTVSGTVTAAGGGSLSATAADGTVFTLNVPAGAVLQDQDVSMTPARATGAFPFAGGLAAGVDLQPSGLVLIGGATLSIHTPAPISRTEETAVAWNGSGEDFFLFPPDPTGGDLRLYILHLGGYGVGRGTDAERSPQLLREPVADDDLMSHTVSPLLRQSRAAAASRADRWTPQATSDWSESLKSAYDQMYTPLLIAMANSDGEPAVVVNLIRLTLEWKAQVEHYSESSLNAVFNHREEEIRSLFTSIVKKALAKIHTQCKSNLDAILELGEIASLAYGLGLEVQPELSAVFPCLTFELNFKSTIRVSRADVGTFTHTVVATLTLRTPADPVLHFPSGEGPDDFSVLTAELVGPASKCTYTKTSGGSTFKARILWENILNKGQPIRFILNYSPGFPFSDFTLNCPDPENPVEIPVRYAWSAFYYSFHPTELGSFPLPLVERGWTAFNQGVASAHPKNAEIGNTVNTEDTIFTLTHKPE